MKIFARDKVYVQKNDLMYGTAGIATLAIIFDKVFGRIFNLS